ASATCTRAAGSVAASAASASGRRPTISIAAPARTSSAHTRRPTTPVAPNTLIGPGGWLRELIAQPDPQGVREALVGPRCRSDGVAVADGLARARVIVVAARDAGEPVLRIERAVP